MAKPKPNNFFERASTICLILTLMVGVLTYCDQIKSFKITNRAWIQPSKATLINPQIGSPTQILLEYNNVGKTTATNSIVYFEAGLDLPNSPISQTSPTSCGNLKGFKSSNLGTVFPTTNPNMNGLLNLDYYTSPLTQQMINGETPIVLRGCIVYETLNETHHSNFCFKTSIKFNNALVKCDDGDQAD